MYSPLMFAASMIGHHSYFWAHARDIDWSWCRLWIPDIILPLTRQSFPRMADSLPPMFSTGWGPLSAPARASARCPVCRQFSRGSKEKVRHLFRYPRFELMQHHVRLYFEVDEFMSSHASLRLSAIDSIQCRRPRLAHGPINMLRLAKRVRARSRRRRPPKFVACGNPRQSKSYWGGSIEWGRDPATLKA